MISFQAPIKTISEPNNRDHYHKKARRKKDQKNVTTMNMRKAQTEAGFHASELARPIVIKLVRIGKRRLDCDNLAGSFKAVRDAIASEIGIDDGSEDLRWHYAQVAGKDYAIQVTIS